MYKTTRHFFFTNYTFFWNTDPCKLQNQTSLLFWPTLLRRWTSSRIQTIFTGATKGKQGTAWHPFWRLMVQRYQLFRTQTIRTQLRWFIPSQLSCFIPATNRLSVLNKSCVCGIHFLNVVTFHLSSWRINNKHQSRVTSLSLGMTSFLKLCFLPI